MVAWVNPFIYDSPYFLHNVWRRFELKHSNLDSLLHITFSNEILANWNAAWKSRILWFYFSEMQGTVLGKPSTNSVSCNLLRIVDWLMLSSSCLFIILIVVLLALLTSLIIPLSVFSSASPLRPLLPILFFDNYLATVSWYTYKWLAIFLQIHYIDTLLSGEFSNFGYVTLKT